ncbi:hypothetical protein BV210_02475 [Halorientalis sp. IM1011]|uniref:hypothetical protein n=1 Tax=Halorientalis sp. IM1011 TaxID=1932360 RepID=UPI00097CC623|nr:hypothetical protein [Halorientalis sp. IM1011]AQL41647.1 hypothetical protein BV210_02475 [Halorientalis sp. IM1011]
MDSRSVLVVIAALVAVSLVGAPVTMGDWGEQASFSVERTTQSDVPEEVPTLRYEDLSPPAQDVVRRTIRSPDGHLTIYGREDWPDQFFYSDYTAPGRGSYAIVYEGQYYGLYTSASGGFPIFYWLLELPFIIYGLMLGWIVYNESHRETPSRVTLFATGPGIGFHLLGPEFDFPLLGPMQFAGLGILAVTGLAAGLVWRGRRDGTD